jgi:hypothetical protein
MISYYLNFKKSANIDFIYTVEHPYY